MIDPRAQAALLLLEAVGLLRSAAPVAGTWRRVRDLAADAQAVAQRELMKERGCRGLE